MVAIILSLVVELMCKWVNLANVSLTYPPPPKKNPHLTKTNTKQTNIKTNKRQTTNNKQRQTDETKTNKNLTKKKTTTKVIA